MAMMTVLIVYYIVLNISGFMMMGADKMKAIRNQRRIPERMLFRLALLGGAVGIFLGMKKFRHKTQHTSFTLGIPLICVVHGGLLATLAVMDG